MRGERLMKYTAYIVLDGVYQPYEFDTDGNPIEYLWTRFGMDTYIDKLVSDGEDDGDTK